MSSDTPELGILNTSDEVGKEINGPKEDHGTLGLELGLDVYCCPAEACYHKFHTTYFSHLT